LDNDAGSLSFTQDLYLYLQGDSILASPDDTRWGDASNMDLLKELFNRDQSSLAVSMSSTKEKDPLLSFKVLLKPKR